MRVLDSFAMAFFNVFGITQPSESARRRAAAFLLALLAAAFVLILTVGYLFYQLMHRA